MAKKLIIQCGYDEVGWKPLAKFLNALDRGEDINQFQNTEGHIKNDLPSIPSIGWYIKHIQALSKRYTYLYARLWAQERLFTLRSIQTAIQNTHPDYLSKERIRRTTSDPRPLLELCGDFGNAAYENRLDKIFGLHGLSSSCCKDSIPVDYSLSWSKVCAIMVHHYTGDHQMSISALQKFHRALGIRSSEVASNRELLSLEGSNEIKGIRGNIIGRITDTLSQTGKLSSLTPISPLISAFPVSPKPK